MNLLCKIYRKKIGHILLRVIPEFELLPYEDLDEDFNFRRKS